ncbi:MAG: 23S rRNA (pseudouridine(1915)-N(3))-methyltransferase RlmH [Bosea sp. (in: a-proteobacteria)]
MHLVVLAIGRLKAGPERELCERYHSRSLATGRDLGFRGPDIIELAESRARRPEDRKAEEAQALSLRAGQTGNAHLRVALDERAPSLGSEVFAQKLSSARDAGKTSLSFIIGGADGLDSGLVKSADWTLSFGALTLPHQMVRALILEQVYRAMTILSGHPYHRS